MSAPFSSETNEPHALTGGILGLGSGVVEEAMSAHFTLSRATFRNVPAWRLEQRSGPDLLPFAVHHRRVRQAVTYARQIAGMVRCVVELEGRHRMVCPVCGPAERTKSSRT